MPTLDELLNRINDRLRAGRIGVTLEIRGRDSWLYLRGTFPSKPGNSQRLPHQQRIALKMKATSEALRYAESTAKLVGIELNLGQFNWKKWSGATPIEPLPAEPTYEQIIDQVEKLFWRNREDNPSSRNTWRIYEGCYKTFPQSTPIKMEVLAAWIESSKLGDRRQQYLRAAKLICQVLNLEQNNLAQYRTKRSSKPVNPRSLPSDEAIVAQYLALKNPGWKHVYGVLAAYGLRPHEVWFLDLAEFPLIRIRESTKTGSRAVLPLHEKWAIDWQLDQVIYPSRVKLNTASSSQLGNRVTNGINRKIEFRCYDLRHCYARRCAELGIQPYEAAKLMGHSTQVHENVYRAWIGEKAVLDRVRGILKSNN